MTIKDDVLTAFDKLDTKDDALWNKDGTPKLEAIRNAAGDQRIKREELADAIGDKRRPEQKAKAEEPAPPPAPPADPTPPPVETKADDDNKPDLVTPAKPEVPGVENVDAPDKVKLVEEAQDAIAAIDQRAVELNALHEKVKTGLKELNEARDKQVLIVEENTEHLDQASAIKRVQAQTQANLAANKNKIAIASQAVAAAGIKLAVPASPLDAMLMLRKRTPEDKANAAAYIQQRSAARLAERTGAV